MEVVRGIAGDFVESVSLIDKFEDKKKSRTSHCYRINYRYVHVYMCMCMCACMGVD